MSTRIQLILAAGLGLLSLSHWFPLSIQLLELLGAFAHFTMVISVLIVVISAWFRLSILGVSAALSAVLCAVLVIPHFSTIENEQKADFTIGQFNLYHKNSTPETAIAELKKVNVDVFTIQELNREWKPIIDSCLKEKYPYQIEEPWGECCYGIGLYSKYPIAKSKVFFLENIPVIQAAVIIKGNLIDIISLHTLPPAFPNQTEERNKQLESVAQLSISLENRHIILGDFNVVPWESSFKRFLDQSTLKSVKNGFLPTFPMHFGFPLIPIDHITYSQGLIPVSLSAVTIAGSDHRGLIASFKLQN